MVGTAAPFTTRDAMRVSGLSSARVRYCVRTGLIIRPERRARCYRYSFHHLLLLRTTKRLLDAGVPLRRIREAFAVLGRRGFDSRALTGLALRADGQALLAAAGGTRWEVGSGQLLLNFADGSPGRSGVRAIERASPQPDRTAEQWYEVGTQLELTSPADAVAAYQRALERAPDMPEAHINLGRLLHVSGDLDQAKTHYTRALQVQPRDAVAAFNLGVLLEDLDRLDEALAMYEHALRQDESLPDIHYNLALLYERRGRHWDALKHLRTYKQLVDSLSGGSP
jgi:tetratricopeptide (TPR) repeat protein